MIYTNWLGAAVLGSAMIASDGTELKSNEAVPLRRSLGGVASNQPAIPAKTCLTEAQCNKQRKKMGFKDEYYYVNTFHHHGCFHKNNKVCFVTLQS